MRVTEMWRSRSRPTVSFELYPARTPKSEASLQKAVNKLAELKPDFVSVTFGAGGSTREGSRELVDRLKNGKQLEIVAYVACYGLGPDRLADVLEDYRGLGVENILAVRGDAPREQDGFVPDEHSLAHASDFLTFAARYDFCLGAAGYPEGHVEADSRQKDLEYLKLKVDSGAQYIITNYFYDNQYFHDFVERCRAGGIKVPILPGVMPVFSVKLMENLAQLCGATINEELRTGLAGIPEDDKDALANFGIDYAMRQCRELLESGAPGVHIYTMDRSKAATALVTRLRKEGLL